MSIYRNNSIFASTKKSIYGKRKDYITGSVSTVCLHAANQSGSSERYAEIEGWSYLETIVEDASNLNQIVIHDRKQFTPKRLVDGRFVMEHNGQEYDLQGRIR